MNARDKRLFCHIAYIMRLYALAYDLPLKEVVPISRAKRERGTYGECKSDGVISIRLRWNNGVPLQPYTILDTISHELAHLRHLSHSPLWLQFHAEMFRFLAASKTYSRIRRWARK